MGKDLFTEIYEKNIWGSGESRSGVGSEIACTEHIRREVSILLKEFAIQSILDSPCGDFNWIKDMDLKGIQYIGIDIVNELINVNIKQYGSESVRFKVMDIISDELPKVDLIICRACFFHLSNNNIFDTLRNFKNSGSKYLLVTHHTWRGLACNGDFHIDNNGMMRRVNLELAPFNLPAPLRNIIECNPNMEPDSTLALWDLRDLEFNFS